MAGDISPEIGEKITEIFNKIVETKGAQFVIRQINNLVADRDMDRNYRGMQEILAAAGEVIGNHSPLNPHLGQFYIVVNSAIGDRNHPESGKFVKDYRDSLKRRLN